MKETSERNERITICVMLVSGFALVAYAMFVSMLDV